MADVRKDMFRKIAKRRAATMQEILTASFGHWPPRGLNISAQHSEMIDVRPLPDSFKIYKHYSESLFNRLQARMETTGCVFRDPYRKPTIYLNSLLCSAAPLAYKISSLASTTGHEAIHVLQNMNRATSYDPASDRIWYSDATSDLIAFELIALNEITKKSTLQKLSGIFNCLSTWAAGGFSYQSEGSEIQARLHQILAENYPKWGRLPANKTELWLAMRNAGLVTPKEIKKQLDVVAKDNPDFTRSKGKPGPVSDINTVLRHLAPSVKILFWEKTLPLLYADLVSMYGDKETAGNLTLSANSGKKTIALARAISP